MPPQGGQSHKVSPKSRATVDNQTFHFGDDNDTEGNQYQSLYKRQMDEGKDN
jgi:hypothetical protein